MLIWIFRSSLFFIKSVSGQQQVFLRATGVDNVRCLVRHVYFTFPFIVLR